jgi:uncharacterized LabA/DUF88 family protein
MNRTVVLVDGFNLYGSLNSLSRKNGRGYKWLDLNSFFNSYKHLISPDCEINNIYFFTALQDYLAKDKPDTIKRHKDYLKCLEDSGVLVKKGRFKIKKVKYHNSECKVCLYKHEEKETDVSIAIKMFELFHSNKCDTCIIVSGDSDLIPAIKTCKTCFPAKKIIVFFPFCRSISKELKKISDRSIKISGNNYLKHQFTNPYSFSNGSTIAKPSNW